MLNNARLKPVAHSQNFPRVSGRENPQDTPDRWNLALIPFFFVMVFTVFFVNTFIHLKFSLRGTTPAPWPLLTSRLAWLLLFGTASYYLVRVAGHGSARRGIPVWLMASGQVVGLVVAILASLIATAMLNMPAEQQIAALKHDFGVSLTKQDLPRIANWLFIFGFAAAGVSVVCWWIGGGAQAIRSKLTHARQTRE